MKNRWESFWQNHTGKPLGKCDPDDLSPEETLFLALHVRPQFLDRIAQATGDIEQLEWANAVAAAFASLLEHCDIDDMDRVYHKDSPWHRAVRPPSVLAGEMMAFLGGLSVKNSAIFAACRSRGSIQAFMRLLDAHCECFQWGIDKVENTQ